MTSSNEDTVQLGTRVSTKLHRLLKIQAARDETTVTALLDEAIRNLLREKRRERSQRNAQKS